MVIIADIDIFNIKPNVVSRDLRGKTFLIYGPNKTGKTTIACQFPRPLLVAFEKGHGAIPGVPPAKIFKWSDALKVKRQLMQDARDVAQGKKSQTTFQTVIIDTAEMQCMMLEEYICEQDDKEDIRKVGGGYGYGYGRFTKELINYMQDLAKVDYTVIGISHSEQVQIDVDGREPYMRIQPSIPKRGLKVYEDMVDIIAYAEPASEDAPDGAHSYLIVRGSKTLDAGSRYKYMPAKIPFTYEALTGAIEYAVDKIAEEYGSEYVTGEPNNLHVDNPRATYDELLKKIRSLNKLFRDNNSLNEYTKIVEKQLGKDKLVKDCTANQTDVLAVIADELQSRADELNLVLIA